MTDDLFKTLPSGQRWKVPCPALQENLLVLKGWRALFSSPVVIWHRPALHMKNYHFQKGFDKLKTCANKDLHADDLHKSQTICEYLRSTVKYALLLLCGWLGNSGLIATHQYHPALENVILFTERADDVAFVFGMWNWPATSPWVKRFPSLYHWMDA